jgi:bifunctional oligoribonuclease and PAP phosphatase NrnA
MTSSIRSAATWTDLDSVFERNSSFLISSHVGIDGDCIGSQLAMYWYLSTLLGKRVVLFNHDMVPIKFRFLENSNVLTTERPTEKFDVGVILDCSNPSRLGWDGLRDLCTQVVNLDHHRDNVLFGDRNVVTQSGAATGQIIYDYFANRKLSYPAHVAESLYTAIMTDTGAFRFSNTNSTILRMCADLSDRGADCSKIYEKVYASFSQHGLLLQSRIWSTMTFYHGGAICSMEMPYKLIDELGATYGDSEGMADLTIVGSDVVVGMLIKYDETETHFSLRSKGQIDVGKIAQSVQGGGGHSSAAGCTMLMPCAQAKPLMLDIIQKELV